MVRKVNDAGIKLIRFFEGCELKAYPDPASPLARELAKPEPNRIREWKMLSGSPWTVGWGTTGLDYFNLDKDGKPTQIGQNTVWTQEQCDSRNRDDINAFAKQVADLLKVDVSENQFAALVSFAYNVGAGNLRNSSLLRLVNQKKFGEAANQFLLWNKAGGKVLLGLKKRREAERRLFLT